MPDVSFAPRVAVFVSPSAGDVPPASGPAGVVPATFSAVFTAEVPVALAAGFSAALLEPIGEPELSAQV